MPVEPPATPWNLPDPADAPDDSDDLICMGADLEPGTLLAAYRLGMVPMSLRQHGALPTTDQPMAWWSPNPRGILPLDGLRVTRSLRQSMKRYSATVDRAFTEVVLACGNPSRPHGWIDHDIVAAYRRLHELGWAHSIEVWADDGALAGGLYGVAIGGLFSGESMFYHRRDASKVALVHLVERLRQGGFQLLDVQWSTEHLASLGAIEIPRRDYLFRLRKALRAPSTFSAEPFVGAIEDHTGREHRAGP